MITLSRTSCSVTAVSEVRFNSPPFQGKLVFNCNYHMTTEEQNLDQYVISEVAFVAPGQQDHMAFTTDFGNLDYVSFSYLYLYSLLPVFTLHLLFTGWAEIIFRLIRGDWRDALCQYTHELVGNSN